jgi:hypothetical protein
VGVVLQQNADKQKGEHMITKKQFDAYESVRKSGVTNMFMVPVVMQYSGLTKDQCLYIMQHYRELKDKYEGADGVQK